MTGPVATAARAHPGAYLHVPFCAHRCSYCSFVALTGRAGEGAYFEALRAEIAARAGEAAGPLDTVYFGGGTPSYVEVGELALTLTALAGTFGLHPDAEVTVEANPDDLDDAALDALARLGATRLSIGVQSLDDGELPYLERRHDAAAAVSAVTRASARLGNVSADLMIGIPGQTRDSLERSVTGLLEGGVSHLSAYLLELEKAPRLVALRKERPELFPDDDEMADRWLLVDSLLDSAGLVRYEMSNWARPGRESRHNLKYWRREETLGFGVAAHSFDGRVRRANSGSTTEYVRAVTATGTAFVSEVPLDELEALREGVLLGLRLLEGVPEEAFDTLLARLPEADRERLGDAAAAGLLLREAGRVRLSRKGVLLSNEVFASL